ncbi:MAG: class I SAM-dependent methyltransferase [Candidatus Micrarchaeota archaeon]|nr:class I SAM-dependent methyltransferase [Candidatus Micrarchaeota archaeon]
MGRYYLKNEEAFGPITARLYSIFTRMGRITDFYRFVVNDIRKSRAKRILDIGTGPGRIPMLIYEAKKRRVYAIDPSPAMVGIAKRNAMKMGYDIDVRLGSSRSIPFSSKFDLIIATISFHHWAEKATSMAHIKEHLAKNGEFRIYEFKMHGSFAHRILVGMHSLDPDELKEAAKNSGMKVKDIKEKDTMLRVSLVRGN